MSLFQNAEIGLGTIADVRSAKKWLIGTFLYVRLKRNPNHYRFAGDFNDRNIDEILERICSKDISLLQDWDLVSKETMLKSTEFGDAMARYYLQFETMKILLQIPPKARLSEIVSRETLVHHYSVHSADINQILSYQRLLKGQSSKKSDFVVEKRESTRR